MSELENAQRWSLDVQPPWLFELIKNRRAAGDERRVNELLHDWRERLRLTPAHYLGWDGLETAKWDQYRRNIGQYDEGGGFTVLVTNPIELRPCRQCTASTTGRVPLRRKRHVVGAVVMCRRCVDARRKELSALARRDVDDIFGSVADLLDDGSRDQAA